MMRGLFITATDTGVGKTVVTAALLRRLRAGGVDATVMKPMQTGGAAVSSLPDAVGSGGLKAPDLDFCLRAAGLEPDADEYARMCPYLYEPACSPHLAGRMARHSPQIPTIVAAARRLASDHDAAVVEGAGGVLVPIDEQHTMLDLMAALGLPVLLVARGALGTINHTLLSIRAIRSAGLTLLGVVVNDPQPTERDFVRQDNPAAIRQFGEVEILADIPYIAGLRAPDPPAAAWEAMDEAFVGFGRIMAELTR
jgi:dethiobiotin synthase